MTNIPELFRFACFATLCMVAGVAPAQSAASPPANSIARLDSTCFTMRSATECERIAKTIAHDIRAILWFGGELERQQRFDEARVAYQAALKIHANHRDLLQGLIRARQGARSAGLLNSSPPDRAADPVFAKTAPIDTAREQTTASSAMETSMQPQPAITAAPRTTPISILSPGPRPASTP